MSNSFLWGVATSGHQIDGNNIHSDWWQWEQKGNIEGGVGSGRAVEHWKYFREDLKLAREMGANSYRFSVEWARWQPKEGEWDDSAIEWYLDLVAECEKLGLEPMLTLQHFTLPNWVAEMGGLSWSGFVPSFLKFVAKVVKVVGGRIPLWCTFNEPMVLLAGQYLAGFMPPAIYSPEKVSAAFANLIRAQVGSYNLIHKNIDRRTGPWKTKPICVGVAHNMIDFVPERHWHPIDRLATALFHRFYNKIWLDAITGQKVQLGIPGIIPFSPVIFEALGKNWVDFIGVNYYFRAHVQWRPKGKHFEKSPQIPIGIAFSDGHEVVSDMGWGLCPEGLFRVLKMAQGYGLPLYVTENGIADATDQKRKAYLLSHLQQLAKSIETGMDLRGYYHWSLIDNFEWIKGFGPRFGLIEVDYDSMNRTLRPSAHLYREVIQAHQNMGQKPSSRVLSRFS